MCLTYNTVDVVNTELGAIQVNNVGLTLFSWEFNPIPPLRNANNVDWYTFVTHFFRESWHPHTLYCVA